jgi:hypothetical protein
VWGNAQQQVIAGAVAASQDQLAGGRVDPLDGLLGCSVMPRAASMAARAPPRTGPAVGMGYGSGVYRSIVVRSRTPRRRSSASARNAVS